MVQEQSDEGVLCKTPLGYREGRTLDGLMTLKNFVEGGSEVADGKVLVAVKSIGGRKKCTIFFFRYTTSYIRRLLGRAVRVLLIFSYSHHEERQPSREMRYLRLR